MVRMKAVVTVVCATLLIGCGDQITEVTEAPLAGHKVHGPPGLEYQLISGQLVPATVRSVSKIIGPDGGELVLLGLPVPGLDAIPSHTLTVPPGAVGEPLRFEMTLSSPDHIEVELNAYKERG